MITPEHAVGERIRPWAGTPPEGASKAAPEPRDLRPTSANRLVVNRSDSALGAALALTSAIGLRGQEPPLARKIVRGYEHCKRCCAGVGERVPGGGRCN